jgi:flagellar biosynthesis protein FlhB
MHHHDPHHNRDESNCVSVHAPHSAASNANAKVDDHGSKVLAIVALIFGSSALMLSVVLLVFCYGLWSRHDLLRMFYEDIKTELIRQGGNPHPHMPGEKP